MLTFVEADDSDLEQIAKLTEIALPRAETPNSLRNRTSGKPSWMYVAKDGDQVVGFKIWYEQDGQIYSWLGAVHPSYRRRRIANTLAGIQEEQSRALGYNAITIKTQADNAAMLGVARKRGFKETKRVPNYWGEKTAVFLELRL